MFVEDCMANIAHMFHFSLTEMSDMSIPELVDWHHRAIKFSKAAAGED